MSESRNNGIEASRQARKMPGWKKALLMVSVVLMLGGLAVRGYSAMRAPAETAAAPVGVAERADEQRTVPPGMAPRGFAPREDRAGEPPADGPTAAQEAEPALLETWAPGVFQLGFGFFAGFCIAYAVRSFFKIAAIGIGVVLLALLGLQYGGLVDINWGDIARGYESVANWLGVYFADFGQFITQHIPSAASGAAGLFVGFRR